MVLTGCPVIDRAGAVAQGRIGLDSPRDISLRYLDRLKNVHPLGEAGGDGRRVCAAGAVGVRGVNSFGREAKEFPSQVKKVGSVLGQVPPFDEDGSRS